jgi:hypothetical protein
VAAAWLTLAVTSCAGAQSGAPPTPSASFSSQVTSAFAAFDQAEAVSISELVRFRGAGGATGGSRLWFG